MTRRKARTAGLPQAEIEAIVAGDHGDPFAVLGPREAGGDLVIRAFVPGAETVEAVDQESGEVLATLDRLHPDGLFAGVIKGQGRSLAYRLKGTRGRDTWTLNDPYRFGPVLGELDEHLWSEGSHRRAYERLGAHVMVHEAVAGTNFAVWAPGAKRVAVVGDFNEWDGRRHGMGRRGATGIWEIFLPEVGEGACYKYEIKAATGERLPLKADPFGFGAELRPKTASVVRDLDRFTWRDEGFLARRGALNGVAAPISIYEVHLASWRRMFEDGDRPLSYLELAEQLIPYVQDMGFTHIELLPITEHPFDGSWGYQPIGLFAPTSRHGTPAEFKDFVEACHHKGIGVILDWVPGHFPTDEHGLMTFDGTHLYEHADPRQGYHQDWNTLIFNYGRTEVATYLLNNALFWLDRYHLDGLRVDAVASMLYLDYSREPGEWVPNRFGGNENLEAVAFLRRMNELAYGGFEGIMTAAEESTAWPGVSRPTYTGGLGFGYKWNMGWMNDTLDYISREPIHRPYHHHQMTFGIHYGFSENFILPLSHDEVVHGKGSLLSRMPGDAWQQFANLRAYFTFMWTHPGKKLLFMGGELAQGREWNFEASLDWSLLEVDWHAGVQRLVRDLNGLYRELPALHEGDCDPAGFQWLEANAAKDSVFAFLRRAKGEAAPVVVVCNFTPVLREAYRIGLPAPGRWRERLNSNAEIYRGSGQGNPSALESEPVPWHDRPHSMAITLPPLACLVFERDG
jgi:1,4-alpha-glucan branching enzyme